MTITTEEMEALTQPFDLKDHQIREGAGRNKQQWLVYIDKIAVIKRLNAVFGGDWGNTIETRQLDGGVVAVDCHITIRGVSRGLNGADSSSFNVHDVAKSAGSDAVKRALTMWGVGLYLYDVPRIYTDGNYGSGRDIDYTKRNAQEKEAFNKFADWYRQQFGNGGTSNTQQAPKPQRKAQTSTRAPKTAQTGAQGEDDPPFATSVEWSKFWVYTKSLGLTKDDVHDALKVDSAKDYQGTKSRAMFLIDAVANRKNKLMEESK